MNYYFRPMTDTDAVAVSGWRYDVPYSVYNGDPRGIATLLDPRNAYYTVRSEDRGLIGMCCFGPDARVPGARYDDAALDVGLGMRPDLTGQRLGLALVNAILDFGRETYHPAAFRLTVATFNRRAITVYERAGFRPGRVFMSSGANPIEFVQMTREA